MPTEDRLDADDFDRTQRAQNRQTPRQTAIASPSRTGEIVITIDGKSTLLPARSQASSQALSRATSQAAKTKIAPTRQISAVRPELVRVSTYGNVAAIGPDGTRPADVYANQLEIADGPMVGLIISGLGLDPMLTTKAINDLPAAVTLSFAPYAKDLPYWTRRARNKGHEVLLEIPMEHGQGSAEAIGPAGLMEGRSPADNLKRLDWLMSRFEGYFGVTNYLGATFTGNAQAIRPIIKQVEAAGLAYFDDTGAVRRNTGATEKTVAEIARVIQQGGDTKRDFAALETLAKRDGMALGKAYLTAEDFDALRDWVQGLDQQDIDLAPASAIFRMDGTSL